MKYLTKEMKQWNSGNNLATFRAWKQEENHGCIPFSAKSNEVETEIKTYEILNKNVFEEHLDTTDLSPCN